MKEVLHISADDYAALYIDGVLVSEGHSIDISSAMEAVKTIGPFNYTSLSTESDLEKYGYRFPDNFSDFNDEEDDE